MPPPGEHLYKFFRDPSLIQQHPEHLVPEDGFQFLQFEGRGDAKHPLVAIEAAVGDEDVAVGIEAEKIAEGLDGNDGTGDGIVFRNCILEKNL